MLGRIYEKALLRLLRRRELDSVALRRLFATRHGIEIGLHSYGCFDPARIPRDTVIGRYCSFAPNAVILNANHGVGFLGMTPYFYLTSLGVVDSETVARTRCTVSDDVWVGQNAVILPSVARIGRGAAIGAGAVVTKDVPDYAVVTGVPGRVARMRFDPETIARIEASRWWERTPAELRELRETDPDFVFDPAGLAGADPGGTGDQPSGS